MKAARRTAPAPVTREQVIAAAVVARSAAVEALRAVHLTDAADALEADSPNAGPAADRAVLAAQSTLRGSMSTYEDDYRARWHAADDRDDRDDVRHQLHKEMARAVALCLPLVRRFEAVRSALSSLAGVQSILRDPPSEHSAHWYSVALGYAESARESARHAAGLP